MENCNQRRDGMNQILKLPINPVLMDFQVGAVPSMEGSAVQVPMGSGGVLLQMVALMLGCWACIAHLSVSFGPASLRQMDIPAAASGIKSFVNLII